MPGNVLPWMKLLLCIVCLLTLYSDGIPVSFFPARTFYLQTKNNVNAMRLRMHKTDFLICMLMPALAALLAFGTDLFVVLVFFYSAVLTAMHMRSFVFSFRKHSMPPAPQAMGVTFLYTSGPVIRKKESGRINEILAPQHNFNLN